MSLAAAILVLGVRASGAQEPPPDPRMLLDLDLFTPPANSNSVEGVGGGSMLDRIRALRALGYLGEPRPVATVPANPAMVVPPSDSDDEVEE